MIEVTCFRNARVAVLGLARSGLAAAEALARGGARVMAWDDAAPRRAAAAAAGIPLADLATADLDGVAALVLSPGIPHAFPAPHPVAARARARGIDIIDDIELLVRSCRAARMVGVTGTNGKSTTAALIAQILAASGRRVALGGNIGVPALALEKLGADGIYVLELSSYQLELTPGLACAVAVLLNITPDHLDRHGGMEGYIAAKERIFAHGPADQCAVVGIDDEICRGTACRLAAEGVRVATISACASALTPRRRHGRDQPAASVHVADGVLMDALDGAARAVLDLRHLARLPGRHNWQNAAAAYAAVRGLGLDAAAAAAGIKSFTGLAHRQEPIAVIDGVRYVNDSKATNADAAANALACYDDILWIAGGRAKEGGIATLAPFFPRIRRAFLIGEAAPSFAATLEGRVACALCGTLEAAVRAAHDAAQGHRGATVLLSPACASFDQFADFEARGAAFRRLVETLSGERA